MNKYSNLLFVWKSIEKVSSFPVSYMVSQNTPYLTTPHTPYPTILPTPRTPGTTHKGIGPAYSSKTMRNGIRIGDLRDMEFFETRLRGLVKQLEGASVCGVVLCVHLSI